MFRINIVYQNLNMPGEILSAIEAPDGSYSVVWSRQPQPDSDAVVYFNHYTYNRRTHNRICPNALRILYMYEPITIDPIQYTRRIWKRFDAILTWNTYLTGNSEAFTFEPGAYYDLPYCFDYGVTPLADPPSLEGRERAICQICGDKYTFTVEAIYSERRGVARWFHSNGRTRMDVFGRPPMDTPNYRGECADKAETFAKYRYALCFENAFHPLWTRGYLSEKILDCMASQTIPVYYGCSNIEDLVPSDCFIDYRRFASLEELDEFLQAMTDEEYLGYAERMQKFIADYNAPVRHSINRLYETVAQILERPGATQAVDYPKDYIQESSFVGKCGFFAMWLLLPHYRFVYPLYSIVRAVRKGLRK